MFAANCTAKYSEEKRHTHTQTHTDVAVKCVCVCVGETQRLMREGFDGGRKGDEEVL